MPKFLVMNVNHAQGVSKKGNPFDFTTMTAYKYKSEVMPSFKGLKPMEFFCESKVFNEVPELPAICEVEYDLDPGYNGQARMTVTSCKLIKKIEIGQF